METLQFKKSKEKKLRQFPKRTAIAFLVIIAVGIPIVSSYQEYNITGKWHTVLRNPLKLAISECLNDTEGNVSACNDFSKLTKYGVTEDGINSASTTQGEYSVSIVADNAAIRFTGTKALGGCIVDLVPQLPYGGQFGYMWEIVPTVQGTSGDSIKKCQAYVEPC